MNITTLRKFISLLYEELNEINYLIRVMEGMATGKRRRGRPPKWEAHLKGFHKPKSRS